MFHLFVPILKGGEDEAVIREALQILRGNEQLNQLETVRSNRMKLNTSKALFGISRCRVRYDLLSNAPKPLHYGAVLSPITHPTCCKRKRRLPQQKSNSNPISAN